MEGEREKDKEVKEESHAGVENTSAVSEASASLSEGEEKSQDEARTEEYQQSAGERAGEIERLKEELKAYEAQVKEYHDRWLRAVAEFENFRKRTEREKERFFEYALEDFVKEFLPVMDALEKGIEAAEKDPTSKDQLLQGVSLIYKNILNIFEKFGVRQIEALGKPFDPFYHEAVSRVNSSEHDEGTIVEEFRKGYMLKDRVIRPSMVAVSMGKGEEEGKEEKEGGETLEASKNEGELSGAEEKEVETQGEGAEGEVPVEILDEGSE